MMVKSLGLVVVALYHVTMAGVVGSTADPTFISTISVDKECYNSGEKIKVLFQLVNINNYDVYVLPWHTPLEGFLNNFLEVKHDRNNLKYKGIMARRSNPTKESYLLLLAGETVKAEVVLNEAYSVIARGHYTVKLKIGLMDVIAKEGERMVPSTFDSMQEVALSSFPIEFNIVA